MSYGELEAGLVRENNDLQARLAQCEGERDEQGTLKAKLNRELRLLQNEHLKLHDKVKQEAAYTKQVEIERDAALERVRELEKGLQFIMFHIEAPQDSDIPADQYIPTLSEAVVCRNEIQRLLALRAGMA